MISFFFLRVLALLIWSLPFLIWNIPVVKSQESTLKGFDAYVEHARQVWEVPGLAVAIVKDGSVDFAKGYGVRKLGSPEPVDTHTLFSIGSTTKAFTSVALALLVDAGKLKWDAPVVRYLPEFRVADSYVSVNSLSGTCLRIVRALSQPTSCGGIQGTTATKLSDGYAMPSKLPACALSGNTTTICTLWQVRSLKQFPVLHGRVLYMSGS